MKAVLLEAHSADCWAVSAVAEGQWDTPWWWPKRGVERRDKRGALQGARRGYYPEWAALECNSTNCSAKATIPVDALLVQAQRDLDGGG